MGKLDDLKFRIKETKKLQPYLTLFDDQLLAGFLRGKRGDMDKTVQSLEYYVNVRINKYKHFTKHYLPSTIQLLDKGLYYMLKEKDPQGRAVVICAAKNWIPSQHAFAEAIAAALYSMDEAIRSCLGEGNELTMIFDCEGVTFAHMRNFTPSNIIMTLDMFIKSFPIRPNGIHFVNENPLIHNTCWLMKQVLSKKIGERFHLHSKNLDKLHEHVPPNILPHFLGGILSIEEAVDESLTARIKGSDAFYQKMLTF